MNNIMKRLTTYTIVIALPTLIASFYGMNLHIPGQEARLGFWFVLTFSALVVVLFIWWINLKIYNLIHFN